MFSSARVGVGEGAVVCSSIVIGRPGAHHMYAWKVQGSGARRGRISITLYGRSMQFGPSIISVHFDCDRCDCASLCSLICAVRQIKALQIPNSTSTLSGWL